MKNFEVFMGRIGLFLPMGCGKIVWHSN